MQQLANINIKQIYIIYICILHALLYIYCTTLYLSQYLVHTLIMQVMYLHYHKDKYFMNCLQRGYID